MLETLQQTQMWLSFAIILFAIYLYASEKISLEMTSMLTIVLLLLLFQLSPFFFPQDTSLLTTRRLLSGFAEPTLFAILGLLIIGQGLVITGALDNLNKYLIDKGGKNPQVLVILILIFVLITSAIMNNTPVVVIFIPILGALSMQLGRSPSLVMIPLSFAAILGGNLTLIGSSTNLLASGALEHAGAEPLQFFDLLIPGGVLAIVGFIYLLVASPFLLKSRANMAGELIKSDGPSQGRQFIVQLKVDKDSPFLGVQSKIGLFPSLKDITVNLIQRGEKQLLPPFDDITLNIGDEIIIAATRSALTAMLKDYPNIFQIDDEEMPTDADQLVFSVKDQMLAEAIISPTSQMRGATLGQISFHSRTNCTVLGIQRRSRMIRTSIEDIQLEAGDVLLLLGERSDVLKLRSSKDVILMEWSTSDVPRGKHAAGALSIFGIVVLTASSGMLPVTIAALLGATALVLTGCLNLRQATNAINGRIVMLVGAAMAMGSALAATGGASFLSQNLVSSLDGYSSAVILSIFFIFIAVMTNILSNNATAVLFTPIALSIAADLGVSPEPFVVAVILAANCSFATPMGYQTNLMVMGPGHYQFKDFIKMGVPLIILLWISFSLFAPFYYNLQ